MQCPTCYRELTDEEPVTRYYQCYDRSQRPKWQRLDGKTTGEQQRVFYCCDECGGGDRLFKVQSPCLGCGRPVWSRHLSQAPHAR
jgi:hypothetical protein